MNMRLLPNCTTLMSFGAVALLLTAQASLAQQNDQDLGEQPADSIELENMDFEEVDSNNDGQIDPEELNRAYDNQLSELGWSEQQMYQNYDQNQDESLDEMEYRAFTSGFVERQEVPVADAPQNNSQQQSGDQSGEKTVDAIVGVTAIRGVTTEDLVDREVVNLEQQTIGTVEDVVKRQGESQQNLVVNTEAASGDAPVVINTDEVHLDGDKLVWEKTSDEANLDELPEYNEDEYVSDR